MATVDTLRDTVQQIIDRTLDFTLPFLYPQRCLGCEAIIDSAESFCTLCQKAVEPIVSPFCERCGVPFATGPLHVCGRCFRHEPAFRRARAWAYYERAGRSLQPLSAAIQRFKYQRNLGTGALLAQLAAEHFVQAAEGYDYDHILPVPLHVDRLRWRGFNQSLLLAQAIGQRHEIAVDPFVLHRIKPTPPQTQLSERERRANVRGAFGMSDPERLAGKRLLVVDDVYTSGATVEECARTLYQGGAQAVDVFTLTRAVFH